MIAFVSSVKGENKLRRRIASTEQNQQKNCIIIAEQPNLTKGNKGRKKKIGFPAFELKFIKSVNE